MSTPYATEEMCDCLREGRHYTAPKLQHVFAMHLLSLEWAEEAAWSLHVRGPREIAAEAIARLRHMALVRSYPARVVEAPAALREAA